MRAPPPPMVPHSTTSPAGPLRDLEGLALARPTEIEYWLRPRFAPRAVPFPSPVAPGNSGSERAPADTRLFAGGFTNLDFDVGAEETIAGAGDCPPPGASA